MKKIIIPFILSLFLCSCGSNPSEAEELDYEAMQQIDTIRISHDSLANDLVFVEQGFEYWMENNALPKDEYSQEFLEEQNLEMINTYNFRCVDKMLYGDLYKKQIDFDLEIDYGHDFNYLLYNYFLFFQEQYSQNL